MCAGHAHTPDSVKAQSAHTTAATMWMEELRGRRLQSMCFAHEQDATQTSRSKLTTTLILQTNNNRHNDVHKEEKVAVSLSPLTSIRVAGQHGQSLQRHQKAQPESPVSWVHGVRVSRGLDGTGPAECVTAARTWCTKQPQQSQQQQLMSARPSSLPPERG